ncbi:MAG: hypothetical protein V2I57_11325 [Xanthomonadales bacterium]|jgi:hypothetical protein|nr:hypothetical protein [Xanthomonadales bacterium]
MLRSRSLTLRPAILALALAFAVFPGMNAAGAETLPTPEVRPEGQPTPKRVLFVGNSYLYYNDSVHNHVRRLAEAAGTLEAGAYQFKSATVGGARLWHHPIDHWLGVGNLGVDEPFEWVVLQPGSTETLSPEALSRLRESARAYVAKIRAIGATPALYLTHAYVPPHRRADPAMTDTVARATINLGNELDTIVIPVGLAFARAYGERPDLALHETFDGSHPNLAGTYLAACVVYRTLYARPTADIDYDYFGELDADTATWLRGVADRTVSDFFAETP